MTSRAMPSLSSPSKGSNPGILEPKKDYIVKNQRGRMKLVNAVFYTFLLASSKFRSGWFLISFTYLGCNTIVVHWENMSWKTVMPYILDSQPYTTS